MKTRSLLLMGTIAICVAAAPAGAQKAKLDVLANVSPENVLYFEGTVTPQKLTPQGQLQVRNEVEVLVEYIEKGGKFRTLPDRVIPTSNEAYKGRNLLEGERLDGCDSTLVEISGAELLPEDEGEAYVTTGTVDLTDAHLFRIITRVRHQWAGTFPEVECFYDISGPYPVKAGVARKRQSNDVFSKTGRFLEHSVSEIGEGIARYGGQAAGLLLAGGANPVGLLQGLLLGEVQQQSGALGHALRFIGGAVGAGASPGGLDQLLSGGEASGDDLTTSLVRGLVARYGGDLTTGGIVGGNQPGARQDFNVTDVLINAAVQQIDEELGGNLGLRNLRINVDQDTAVVASQMPSLDGRGHLEPIIAYMLVDAALAAPWTEAVAAVFDTGSGGQMSISAPTEAARNLARGQIDVDTFLQLCRFADPDLPVVTSGGIVGDTAAPARTSTASSTPLLPQAQLPPGWLSSGTHTVDVSDLDAIIPGLNLSAQSISWGGIQVIQANSRPVTVVGLDLGEAGRALELMQMLGTLAGGEAGTNLLRLSTDPPLHAVQSGERTYLLQGDQNACAEVAQVLTTGGAMQASATPGIGLTGLFPGDATVPAPDPGQPGPATAPQPAAQPQPARPQPEDTQTPPAPAAEQPEAQDAPATPAPAPAPIVPGLPEGPDSPPEAPEDPAAAPGFELPEEIALDGSGYLRKTYLCTVVEDGQPVELEGPLAAGSERLGVYLELRGAPRSSMLEMELYRGGFSCGRRMMGVNGDRRTVAYFAPSGGFSPGKYWLEIRADDTLVSRMVFEVK